MCTNLTIIIVHSEITLLYDDRAADHVTPITGYLAYDEGITSQNITVMSKDDDIAEPSTPLVVLLSSSNNRGRITARPNSQASLTGTLQCMFYNNFLFYWCLVLKSDRANGEFSFTSASLMPRTSAEGDVLSYVIERRGGTFGSVLVTWEVQSLLSNNDTDFNPPTNEVRFEPQITSQVAKLLATF